MRKKANVFVSPSGIEGMPCIDDLGIFESINHLVNNSRVEFLFPAMDNALLVPESNHDKLHGSGIGSCQLD